MDIPKENVFILPSWMLVVGWLTALPLPLIPSNIGNTQSMIAGFSVAHGKKNALQTPRVVFGTSTC